MLFLASPSSWASSVSSQAMNSLASGYVLRALRDRHDIAADEGGNLARLDAGQEGHAEIEVGNVLLEVGEQEAARALDADLAGLEFGR